MRKTRYIILFLLIFSGCSKKIEEQEAVPLVTPSISSTEGGKLTPGPTKIPDFAAASIEGEDKLQDDSFDGSAIENGLQSLSPEEEAFISVLKNETTFFDVSDNEYVFLNELLDAGDEASTFEVPHFAVIDMDEDGSTEVVLEIGFFDNIVFYEVLRYSDGQIEGYIFGHRQLYDLKSDGTFSFSGGAGYYGWARLKYTEGKYENVILGLLDNDNIESPYMIGKEQVSEKVFEEMFMEQDQKEAVVWYDFSVENFIKAF